MTMQPNFSAAARCRAASRADAVALAAIANHWIAASSASFETRPVTPGTFVDRINEPRLPLRVIDQGDGEVIGYAGCRWFRPFAGSAHVAETAIYLRPACTGHGLGQRLYQDLLAHLPAVGFAAAVAFITVPNPASEHLHASCGFRQLTTLPDLGRKHGRSFAASFWHRQLSPESAESS